MKRFKSFLTIAFTTCPLTSASQIDIIVLITSKIDKTIMYLTSGEVQLGITCLTKPMMRDQNKLSTFPRPYFFYLMFAYYSFDILLFFEFDFLKPTRRATTSAPAKAFL